MAQWWCAGALKTCDRIIGFMAERPDRTPWPAGEDYCLADVALVARVEGIARTDATGRQDPNSQEMEAGRNARIVIPACLREDGSLA
jgi:hypothetical protein